MSVASLWNHFSGETKFPTLDSELRADVAIIGGGICGISVAQELAELGLSVIVLEARKVGGGTTAHSTGNLYATTDKNLKKLCGKHGLDVVRTLTRARLETISKIESNVNTLEIDCDFRRGPWFLYSATESAIHQIDDEYQAAREIGLEVSYADLSQPYRALKSITMPHQARVNSMLYVQGLAQKIQSAKCRIFENTQVRSIEKARERTSSKQILAIRYPQL